MRSNSRMIENRMVVDSEWAILENCLPEEVPEKLNRPGYKKLGTGFFVPEEDAFHYAMERISQVEDEKRAFIDWFFSGSWIKEEA